MKNNHAVGRAIRNLNGEIAATKQRISQSMSATGYANSRCRALQQKLARLQKAKQTLRHI